MIVWREKGIEAYNPEENKYITYNPDYIFFEHQF